LIISPKSINTVVPPHSTKSGIVKRNKSNELVEANAGRTDNKDVGKGTTASIKMKMLLSHA